MKRWTQKEAYFEPDFPLVTHDNIRHPPLELHTHEDFSELTIVYGGKAVHFLEDAEFPIQTGDVFVLTGDLAHGYRDVEDLFLLNIDFLPQEIETRLPYIATVPGYHALFHLEPKYRVQHGFESRLRLAPTELERAMGLGRELLDAFNAKQEGYKFRCMALLMRIIWFVSERYMNSSQPDIRSLTRLGQVISFIESNYSEPISLDELCEVAHLSSRGLQQTFRKATGFTPIEYLLRVRVARAMEMLRNTERSITEIAMDCGFDDSNYFTRQFKRITGGTPTAYRKGPGVSIGENHRPT